MNKAAAAASALALGALTTPAHADEPGDAHDWTGFYLGTGVAIAGADANWEIDGGEGFVSDEDGPADASDRSAAVALQAGYNHQFGSLLVGGELDFSLADIDADTRFDGGEGAELRTKLNSMGTVRARVGYAMDNVLIFATGGLAVGDLENTYNSDGSPSTKRVSTTIGWVAGGGVEVAVTETLSLFGEGFFAAFEGDGTARGPSYDDKFDVDTDIGIARFGINVRF